MRRLIKHREFIVFMILTVLIFVVIYHNIISKEILYAYQDIGCDTINLGVAKAVLQNRVGTGYTFQWGLGAYLDNSVLNYIIPYNAILYGADLGNYHYRQMIALLVKTVTCAIFSYLFLSELTENKTAAVIGGLAWIFSSYMTVWAQHYGFSTGIALFSMAMFFLLRFLRKKRSGIFLVIPLALLCILGYYWIYLSGVFLALFTLGYCIYQNRRFREIIISLIKLAGMAVISACIAMYTLQSSLSTFFSSTRMEDVTGKYEYDSFFYGKEYVLTFIARLFSPDMIGTGDDYSGAYNYYEAALLATSILGIFAVVYLLQTRYKKTVAVAAVISVAALMIPSVSQVLNMNPLKQRWAFMLDFLMIIAIAMFIKSLMEDDHTLIKGRAVRTAVIADLFIGLLLFVLAVAHHNCLIVLNKPVFFMTFGITVIYSALIFFYGLKQKMLIVGLIGVVVICEVTVFEYAPVNMRKDISTEEWETSFYNDGTSEVIEELESVDGGLYRVNKTYISQFYNDAMVQGYNGLWVYNNLNSAELVNFYTSAGYELLNNRTHYIYIPYTDVVMNSLLGTKYVIARSGEEMDSTYYSYVDTVGEYDIYLNNYAQTFGYLYTAQLDADEALSYEDKTLRQSHLAYGFYVTEGETISSIDMIIPDDNELADSESVLGALGELQSRSMTDIEYSDNVLTGMIENDTDSVAMLALAVIYDEHWVAYVDGEECDTININGGLIGIEISPGSHSIYMEYVPDSLVPGQIITLMAMVGYAVLVVFVFRRRRR